MLHAIDNLREYDADLSTATCTHITLFRFLRRRSVCLHIFLFVSLFVFHSSFVVSFLIALDKTTCIQPTTHLGHLPIIHLPENCAGPNVNTAVDAATAYVKMIHL